MVADLIFKAVPFLWLIFLLAVPIAIRLAIRDKARTAYRLVSGELLLTLLLVIAGLLAGSMSGSHATGWDLIGLVLWSIPAFIVAGVTGVLVAGIVIAELIAKGV